MITKDKKSLISLQELYEGVGVQRLSCKGVAPSGAKSGAQKGGQVPLFL
jgi:hypothetical protein